MAKTTRKFGMALAVALVAASPAFAGDSTLVLRIDNRGRVPAAILHDAQVVAADVFNAIGVNVRWTDNTEAAAAAAMHVTVVLLSGARERQVLAETRASENVFGFAPRNSGRVYIFSDRLANLARTKDRPLRLVLGRVLAHEVGHQLLPGKGHSASGIMRASLDYRSDEPGFTADEASSIHTLLSATVQARIDTATASSAN